MSTLDKFPSNTSSDSDDDVSRIFGDVEVAAGALAEASEALAALSPVEAGQWPVGIRRLQQTLASAETAVLLLRDLERSLFQFLRERDQLQLRLLHPDSEVD